MGRPVLYNLYSCIVYAVIGSAERRKIIDRLRKDGDHLFNINENLNNGTQIVCRVSRKRERPNDHYRICPECKGMYSKLSLRHHYKRCHGRTMSRDIVVRSRKLQRGIHKVACTILKEQIFPVFRDTNPVQELRNDRLFILYGNTLCSKYKQPYLHKMIRAKLGLIAKFFKIIKALDASIVDLADVIRPSRYKAVLEAANILGKADCQTGYFQAYAPPLELGTALRKIANELKVDCITENDDSQLPDAKKFMTLMKKDYPNRINSVARESQKTYKRRKKVDLPSTDDIKLLSSYLASKRSLCMKTLLESYSFLNWKNLAGYTLASIHVFNRKRAGEVSRIRIEDYERRTAIDETMDADIYNALSKDEQATAKKYTRFAIRGKLGREVPVLLNPEDVRCIELIIKFRTRANVPNENPYIFGMPGSLTRERYLELNPLIAKYSVRCGAAKPHCLRGTLLRKHVATYAAITQVPSQKVKDLASWLGHHDNIHREHYRLPVASREITEMSLLLENAQGKKSA